MIIAPSIALTNKNFSPINFRTDVLAFFRRKNTSRLIAIAPLAGAYSRVKSPPCAGIS